LYRHRAQRGNAPLGQLPFDLQSYPRPACRGAFDAL
jgi:hypothetical protein